jgi:hypothetical protein
MINTFNIQSTFTIERIGRVPSEAFKGDVIEHLRVVIASDLVIVLHWRFAESVDVMTWNNEDQFGWLKHVLSNVFKASDHVEAHWI